MALHFLDNVLLLDFSLEPAQGVFQRLALLKLYFCQTKYTSKPNLISVRAFGITRRPTKPEASPRKILRGAQKVLIS
jgi:hypothetical protein